MVLAQSDSAYTLEIQPVAREATSTRAIDALGELVEIQPRDRKRFRKLLEESKNFESLPLRTRLTDEEVARFAVNRYRFPGVEIKARLFRNYPLGEVGSHFLGHIGRINDRDLERIAEWDATANYKGTDYIGKLGVELSYERELHGTTGVEEVEVDAGGRAVRTLSRVPPIAGNNLRLSIDIKLQQAAEAAFGDAPRRAGGDRPGDGRGARVREPARLRPEPLRRRHRPCELEGAERVAGQADAQPAAASGAYPPGSTIKPFLALGALASGRAPPRRRSPTRATSRSPGHSHRFRDDKPGGHGAGRHVQVDRRLLRHVLLPARRRERHRRDARVHVDAGVRRVSPASTSRASSAGVLPSREWKRKRFAGTNYREEHRKWYLGDSISAGIGQGYTAFTPAAARRTPSRSIANDGVAFRPHLVKQIENVRTGEVTRIAAEPTHTLDVKKEHLEVIRSALVGVGKEGTSRTRLRRREVHRRRERPAPRRCSRSRARSTRRSKIDERLRDHAWYVAYAPADRRAHRARGAGRERRLRCAGRGADRAAGVRLLPRSAIRRTSPAPVQRAARAEPDDQSD